MLVKYASTVYPEYSRSPYEHETPYSKSHVENLKVYARTSTNIPVQASLRAIQERDRSTYPTMSDLVNSTPDGSSFVFKCSVYYRYTSSGKHKAQRCDRAWKFARVKHDRVLHAKNLP